MTTDTSDIIRYDFDTGRPLDLYVLRNPLAQPPVMTLELRRAIYAASTPDQPSADAACLEACAQVRKLLTDGLLAVYGQDDTIWSVFEVTRVEAATPDVVLRLCDYMTKIAFELVRLTGEDGTDVAIDTAIRREVRYLTDPVTILRTSIDVIVTLAPALARHHIDTWGLSRLADLLVLAPQVMPISE